MKPDEAVQAWRWRVETPGPHLTSAVPAMEAIRAASAYMRHRLGYGHFPESFHGGDKTGHRHAFWLPEDENEDGLIDHIWVYCANGMDAGTISALAGVEWFWAATANIESRRRGWDRGRLTAFSVQLRSGGR